MQTRAARSDSTRGWERLDPAGLDQADLAAWRELADRAAEPNPFYRPEYLLPNLSERHDDVSLLVVRGDGRWLACVPIRSVPANRTFPLPHVEALVDSYSVCSTPLIDREHLRRGVDGLLGFVDDEHGASALLLASFPPDGPVGADLTAAAIARGIHPVVYLDGTRAAWHRWSDGGSPGAGIHESERHKLARRTRGLERELGADVEVVDRAGDPDAWEAFLALEASGWKAEAGTALASSEADAAFFRRMCAGMSATGHLRLVALEGGGRTVAMECHLIEDRAAYVIKIAYASDLHRYSPGVQLGVRVIDGFHEQGLDLADSCAAEDSAHINRLWPERRRMQTLLLPTAARSARLVGPTVQAKRLARHVRDDLLRHHD